MSDTSYITAATKRRAADEAIAKAETKRRRRAVRNRAQAALQKPVRPPRDPRNRPT